MPRHPMRLPATNPAPATFYDRLLAEWAGDPHTAGLTFDAPTQGVLALTEVVWHRGGPGSLTAGKRLARIASLRGAPKLAREYHSAVDQRRGQMVVPASGSPRVVA